MEAILRLRGILHRQHKALATEESYVHWLRHYMGAIPAMPTGWTSEQKLERFLTQLAVQRQVAASTQNQAFNAILFFYKEVLGKLRPAQPKRMGAATPKHSSLAPWGLPRQPHPETLIATLDCIVKWEIIASGNAFFVAESRPRFAPVSSHQQPARTYYPTSAKLVTTHLSLIQRPGRGIPLKGFHSRANFR